MDEPHELGVMRRGRTIAVLRGLAGAIPGAGPMLVELVNEGHPQPAPRADRELPADARRAPRWHGAGSARRRNEPAREHDLFEDGAHQAARALSEERREQIARLVAEAISDERRDYLKRVLRLLEQLEKGRGDHAGRLSPPAQDRRGSPRRYHARRRSRGRLLTRDAGSRRGR